MACHCKTSTLRLFLRNVVQIEWRPNVLHAAPNTSIPSRQRLSTLRPLVLENSLSTKQSAALLPRDIPGGEKLVSSQTHSSRKSTTSPRPKKWPAASLTSSNAFSTRKEAVVPSDHDHENDHPGAILDINPDTIDALSSEFQQEIAVQASDASKNAPRPRRSSPLMRPTTGMQEVRAPTRSTQDMARARPGKEYYDDGQPYLIAKREPWQAQKAALKDKFQNGWSPRKRLSPDALAGIRAIHAQFPEQYPTSVLAEKFQVSPESIRRILKSNWMPKENEELDRQRRWFNRGQKVWVRYAELGLRPPNKWRALGIGKKANGV